MRKFLWSAFLTLAIAQTAAPAADPQVRMPDWVSGGYCSIRREGHAPSTVDVHGGVLDLPCSSGSAEIACDFIGAEPIDASLKDFCTQLALPLARAKNATLVRADEGSLKIEWLRLDPAGRTLLQATRVHSTGSTIEVPVSSSPGRLIRFSRSGYAPVTVAAAELMGSDNWRLPPPVAGAELLVVRVASPVAPETYLLEKDGKEATVSRAPGDLTPIRGLAPGTYHLVPLFVGGVRAPVQEPRLEAERSTVVVVPRQQVGGIRVTLPPTMCSDVGRMRVMRVVVESSTLPGGGTSTRTVGTPFAVVEAVCDAAVGGLPAGDYEVLVDGRQAQPLGRKSVRVEVDAVSDVVLTPSVRLSGVVTLNGRAVPQATVEFVAKGSSRPTAQPKTDDAGRYVADFDSPGSYAAFLRIGSVPVAGQQHEVAVKAGENTFDWKLVGGSLALTIDNIQRDSGGSVQLDLDQLFPAVTDGRPGFSYRARSTDPELTKRPMLFQGLGFGTYAIRAKQLPLERAGTTKTSRRIEFSLSEAKPDATLTLVLQENNGRLLLTDSTGQPVKGASIYGRGFSAEETEPGAYSMDGVPPGFPLNIRAAGYAPACRTAPDGTTLHVLMDAGRTVEVRFPGVDAKTPSPLGTLGWSDSECRIALDGFPFVKLPVGSDGVPGFAISNFPSAVAVNHSFLNEPPRTFMLAPGQVLVIPAVPIR